MKKVKSVFLILSVAMMAMLYGCDNTTEKTLEKEKPGRIEDWEGTYSVEKMVGRDPVGGAISYLYTLTVSKDSCIFF